MRCPRLDHFAKIIPGKKPFTTQIMNCCVMVDQPRFSTYDEMMQSQWLKKIRQQFENDKFPKECIRCEEQEKMGLPSDRILHLDYHNNISKLKEDYLVVSLLLDTVCNTACQFCDAGTSSKIASLQKKIIKIKEVGNYYDIIPVDRITQLDFEGGEPSNSKNVIEALRNLPKNVKHIKIYTNARRFIDELTALAESGIVIQISMSLDGVGKVQEYVRWPTKWDEYLDTVKQYKELKNKFPNSVDINFKTTVCSLNINDIENIINFANEQQIVLTMNKLSDPIELDSSMVNKFTIQARDRLLSSTNENIRKLAQGTAIRKDNSKQIQHFIQMQDTLRGIDIRDYIA